MTRISKLKQRTGREVEGVHSPLKPFYQHKPMQGFRKEEPYRTTQNHDADVRGINLITNCSTTSVDAEQTTQGGTNE